MDHWWNNVFSTSIILLLLTKAAQADPAKGHSEPDSHPADRAPSEARTGPGAFSEISKSEYFVDKTMLINVFLTYTFDHVLVTAPRGFGKTINLDMIKEFVEIKVNGTGERLGTFEAERLFESFKIFKAADVVKRHLGQYPVISIDLKCDDNMKSDGDVLDSFRKAMQSTYRKHTYLLNSSTLQNENKIQFQRYISTSYRNMNETDVIDGLDFLIACLYVHFKRKVILLIDEYDSAIGQSMFNKELDTRNGVSLVSSMIMHALQHNIYVARSFITGTCNIAGAGLSSLNYLGQIHFLKFDNFAEHFGFTEKEVAELFDRHGAKKIEREVARSWYGGYVTKSQDFNLYNPWSITQYLISKRAQVFCKRTGYIPNMDELLQYPFIKEIADKLIMGLEINVDLADMITLEDVVDFKDTLLLSNQDKELNSDLIFSLFVESGYLTYSDKEMNYDDEFYVRIPNIEIRAAYVEALSSYYDVVRDMSRDSLKSSLGELSTTSHENVFPKFISLFKRYIELLNDKGLSIESKQYAFQALLYSIVHETKGWRHGNEVNIINRTTSHIRKKKRKKGKLNIGRTHISMSKDNLGIIFELKCGESAQLAFNETIEKEFFHHRKSGSTKITNQIRIGLNVDSNSNVTMRYQINNDRIFDL